jgi:hypothetical protein
VGGDYGIDGTAPGLLLTETDGTWAPGIEAPLPANAMGPPIDGGDEPGVVLSSVSCASAGNCTVVGTYDAGPDTSTTGGDQEGLLLSQTNGTWATGTEAGLPADADADPLVSLTSVSCASVANCSAVGDYGGSGDFEGLLLTETAGVWSATAAGLPAAAGDEGSPVVLRSVSCAAVENCAGVGSYDAQLYLAHGLLIDSTPSTTSSGPPPPGGGAPSATDPSSSAPPVITGTDTVGSIGASTTQIKADLSHVSAPTGANARITALLRHGGYTFEFPAPGAGTLAIDWYQVPAGAHLARAPKPILIASGAKTFTSSGTSKITVKLTGAGRRLLKVSRHLTLTVIYSFTPRDGSKTGERRLITIKR